MTRAPIIPPETIAAIRAELESSFTLDELAAQYGLTRSAAHSIVYAMSYIEPEAQRARFPRSLSWEQVEEIRTKWANRPTLRKLSAKYKIPVRYVGFIKNHTGAYK